MRILLVSDSHGNNLAIERLAKLYPTMDLYLHAGDSESYEFSLEPFRSVLGNCDHFADFPEHLEIAIPNGKIWMQHRPNIEISKLKENKITLFLYGHTHRRDYHVIDGITFINPGAISFPRDDYYLSYAIIDIDENGIDVTFKQLEDE